ncbi:hypothetical protein TRVA0_009S02432 [Trichomonascus vanleenenianus]|uniref:thioredoxin-like protein 1 n=1 Tax=Trichomonascus vanleenenianus TaxID=2268995 RepID=UPI003ECB11E8
MTDKIPTAATQGELQAYLDANELCVVKFTASWCGPCQAIAPIVERLYREFTNIQLVEVDIDVNKPSASKFSVTSVPTFVFAHRGKEVERVRGADPNGITAAFNSLSEKNPSAKRQGAQSSGGSATQPVDDEIAKYIPKGYEPLNELVLCSQGDLLNVQTDDHAGSLRGVLALNGARPIVSDADSQVLAYLPLQNKTKLYSVLIKATRDKAEGLEAQLPRQIKIWANTPAMISFEDASSSAKALHSAELADPDENGWFEVKVRFVHFQKVSSLVLFLEGEDEDDPTLIERIVLVGSAGESREPGKLEKISDE